MLAGEQEKASEGHLVGHHPARPPTLSSLSFLPLRKIVRKSGQSTS